MATKVELGDASASHWKKMKADAISLEEGHHDRLNLDGAVSANATGRH
jgi:hypothetical protein